MKKLNLLIVVVVLVSCGYKITTVGIFFAAGNVNTQAAMGHNEWIGDDVTVSTAPIVTELISTPILSKKASPVKLIFDTDMDSDVDDVGALAMLHAMMNNGEVEILAVMVSSTCPGSAACIDAINTYYGRPDLPIGVKKGNGVNRDVGFVSKVANKFPQDIGSSANAPDAKVLYRQILAGLPDKNVKILTVGYLSNLEDLLKTSGDSYSSLNGRDLVDSKVTEYVCMGGKYPSDLSYQGNGNFEPDGKAVKYVNQHWP
ncbi:MAG: nucleoside hydrolase, partial [Cyclobacteriaceae bacterium]|nr:nucleoside hydrolase [Cyclobacteriaceae bacterium]